MPKPDLSRPGVPCWIDLFTSDPDKTRAFYGALFGWVGVAAEEFGGYINFSKDDQAVAGAMKNDGESGMPDMWSVYLSVEDAELTAKGVEASGGQVMVAPMPVGDLGTMVVFADVGQAGIGAWQPAAFTGFEVVAEPGTPNWFELHTRDYDAAVAFYRQAFAWDTHVMSDEADFRYSTFGEGDAQAAGIMDAAAMLPEGVPAHWSIYFGVEDADAALRQVVELGGSVVREAEDTPFGRLAQVTDSTGAQFRIVQPL